MYSPKKEHDKKFQKPTQLTYSKLELLFHVKSCCKNNLQKIKQLFFDIKIVTQKTTQPRVKKYNRMQVTLNEVNGTSILLYFFPRGYIAFKAYNF